MDPFPLDGGSEGRRRVDPLLLEGEAPPTEDFPLMPRAAASGEQTVLLQVGQTRHLAFVSAVAGRFTLLVRYSNDTKAPPDVVAVAVDGREVGRFAAVDTGDEGHGWNAFRESSAVYADLEPGPHELALTPISGDSFGTEIDRVIIAPADTYSPSPLDGSAAP